jgi:glycosyltransferase involved in cell wall biosynthesis
MKIFLDARTAHVGGIDTYATNLLSALLAIDTENDYFVLSDKRMGQKGLTGAQEFVVPTMNRLVWLGWNETSLPRLLSRTGIDVYHSVKQVGAIRSKTTKVLTIHDACFFLFPEAFGLADRSYWRFMQRLAASKYDFILTISNSSRDCIMDVLPVPDARIGVTYLGIDHTVYENSPVDAQSEARVRDKYSLPEAFIFWVGKMMKTKNVERLVESYAILRRRGDIDCALVLGGRQSDSYESIRLTVENQERRVSRDVHFTGLIDAEDLPVIYKLASAFVFPSTHEGFGIPPLEAMACGTPVVAASTYSLPEVLGEAALFCNPTDLEEMAQQIDAIINQPAQRAEMVRKGYAQASRYTYEECARQTLSHYRRISDT